MKQNKIYIMMMAFMMAFTIYLADTVLLANSNFTRLINFILFSSMFLLLLREKYKYNFYRD